MAIVTEKSSTGLDANLAAMLCYAIGWVTGLIFFVVEKDSRFVKFHAMQSIIVSLALTVDLVRAADDSHRSAGCSRRSCSWRSSSSGSC